MVRSVGIAVDSGMARQNQKKEFRGAAKRKDAATLITLTLFTIPTGTSVVYHTLSATPWNKRIRILQQ